MLNSRGISLSFNRFLKATITSDQTFFYSFTFFSPSVFLIVSELTFLHLGSSLVRNSSPKWSLTTPLNVSTVCFLLNSGYYRPGNLQAAQIFPLLPCSSFFLSIPHLCLPTHYSSSALSPASPSNPGCIPIRAEAEMRLLGITEPGKQSGDMGGRERAAEQFEGGKGEYIISIHFGGLVGS